MSYRRAERRIGEMMEEMRKAGQLGKASNAKGSVGFQKPHVNLASQGIDKNLAKLVAPEALSGGLPLFTAAMGPLFHFP